MRVTNNLMIRHWMRDYGSISQRMDRTLHQISTGRQFNVPSDEPVKMSQSIRIQTDIFELEQYQKNIGDAKSWMDASDSAMQSTLEVINRVRELAVYGGNGTLTPDSREALAMETDSLLEELVNIGNSNLGGRYIFSGLKTNQIPYSLDPVLGCVYQGNTGILQYEIGKGITMDVSLPGGSLFDDGTVNLLNEVKNLGDALRDPTGDPAGFLDEIDKGIDNILRWEAELGSRLNRMEMADSRTQEVSQYLTQIESEQVDIDLAEVTMQLKMQENVQRAALATGARIIQPSLVDFLK